MDLSGELANFLEKLNLGDQSAAHSFNAGNGNSAGNGNGGGGWGFANITNNGAMNTSPLVSAPSSSSSSASSLPLSTWGSDNAGGYADWFQNDPSTLSSNAPAHPSQFSQPYQHQQQHQQQQLPYQQPHQHAYPHSQYPAASFPSSSIPVSSISSMPSVQSAPSSTTPWSSFTPWSAGAAPTMDQLPAFVYDQKSLPPRQEKKTERHSSSSSSSSFFMNPDMLMDHQQHQQQQQQQQQQQLQHANNGNNMRTRGDEFMSPDEFGLVFARPWALLQHQSASVRWANKVFHETRKRRRERLEHRSNSSDSLDDDSKRITAASSAAGANDYIGCMFVMEMGVGKTPTSSAWALQWRKRYMPAAFRTPILVVTPKSLMTQWAEELNKFFGGSLRCIVYHKSVIKEKMYNLLSINDLMTFDVIITCYDCIKTEASRFPNLTSGAVVNKKTVMRAPLSADEDDDNNSSGGGDGSGGNGNGGMGGVRKPDWIRQMEEMQMKNGAEVRGPALLFLAEWSVIIMDESQNLANPESALFRSMMALRSKHRLAMSGTPIRNTDMDMYSQLRLVNMDAVWSTKDWKEESYDTLGLRQYVLVMTREQAKIPLPLKHEHAPDIDMNEHQMVVYEEFVKMGKVGRANKLKTNASGSVNTLTMMLRLRQIAIAPHLITVRSSVAERKHRGQLAKQQKQQLNAAAMGSATNMFMNADLSSSSSSNFGGVESKRSTSQSKSKSKSRLADTDTDMGMEGDDNGGGGGGEDEEDVMMVEDEEALLNGDNDADSGPAYDADGNYGSDVRLHENGMPLDGKSPFGMMRSAREYSEEMAKMDVWLHDRRGTAGYGAPKMAALRHYMRHVIPKDRKVIIFSCFVSALRLAADMLREDGIVCELSIGEFSTKTRQENIEKFKNTTNGTRVLLMTYAVGGAGLNLTAASFVLHLDMWWSPTLKQQADARAHRIGQEQEVHVVQLMTKNTVDAYIKEVSVKKLELADNLLGNTMSSKDRKKFEKSVYDEVVNRIFK